jgi:hypothetical protein
VVDRPQGVRARIRRGGSVGAPEAARHDRATTHDRLGHRSRPARQGAAPARGLFLRPVGGRRCRHAREVRPAGRALPTRYRLAAQAEAPRSAGAFHAGGNPGVRRRMPERAAAFAGGADCARRARRRLYVHGRGRCQRPSVSPQRRPSVLHAGGHISAGGHRFSPSRGVAASSRSRARRARRSGDGRGANLR